MTTEPRDFSSRSPRRRRGFSLLETLIAISLLLAMFSGMFTFLFDTLDKRDRVMEITQRRRALNTLFERVERDLVTVIASGAGESGVIGDETSLTLLTRAVIARRALDGGARAVLADLERSRYRFEGSGAGISFSRVSADGIESERTFTAMTTVHRVRFRYHDGASWSDAFDCVNAGQLPKAIEIAVWYEPTEEERLAMELEAARDDMMLERETFDPTAGFDESAAFGDGELADEPLPDRIRVIVVPDAEAIEAPATDLFPPDEEPVE